MRGSQNIVIETHTASTMRERETQHILRGSKNNVRETHTANTMREREIYLIHG